MSVVTSSFFFFFNDTATTEIYTLSLHDALPICRHCGAEQGGGRRCLQQRQARHGAEPGADAGGGRGRRGHWLAHHTCRGGTVAQRGPAGREGGPGPSDQ